MSVQHKEPERPVVYEPPDLRGRKHVERVANEYRVREDQCLADKLQSEEFNNYFENNKSARQLHHLDINAAKEIFLREAEESGLLTRQELKQLCNDDTMVAEELARRIQIELDLDVEKRIAMEMQDEEFARYLAENEKARYLAEKEAHMERRLKQERRQRLQQEEQEKLSTAETSQGERSWTTDFEVGASPGPKTQKDLQKLKDESIARQMQLEEAEKKQQQAKEDMKIALSFQREEKERAIREQERRDSAKRAKEQAEQQPQPQQERRAPTGSFKRSSQKSQSSPSVGAEYASIPRAQDVRPRDPATEQKRKQLQSVDATGRRVAPAIDNGVYEVPVMMDARSDDRRMTGGRADNRHVADGRPDNRHYADGRSDNRHTADGRPVGRQVSDERRAPEGILNEQPRSDHPIPIQNTKRASFQEKPVKKKWFSKKEKSPK